MSLIAAAILLHPAAFAKPRLVSIVWDGAADWVVDDLLERGDLPNVARLAKQGIRAESVIPAWPSKTAVGHAALFTGCWPNHNGVSNNTVGLLPRSEHDLSESRRGFDSRSLLAEPIWVTAVKAGRKVAALSAATSFPPDPFLEQIRAAGANPNNFVEFSGFETEWAPGKMIGMPSDRSKTFSVTVAGQLFDVKVLDSPSDPVAGLDTVEIKGLGTSAVIKPRAANEQAEGWSTPFKIVKDGSAANVYFRLWSLAADGSGMELYQRKVSPLYGTESAAEIEKYVDAYGGFHDDPFFAYDRAVFGKPLYEGGTGEAERRCIELVAQDCAFLKRGFAYAWKHWKPDLTFHYTPMSDSAGHQWVGVLDDGIAGYDQELASKLWPFYRKVYQLQDEWLGFVLDTVGKDTVVALMSDHGMAGAHSYVYLNNALEAAGLLVRDAKGQIDWSKTKAAIPSWSDFFIVVNTSDRKGGMVLKSEVPTLLKTAERALLEVKDVEGNPIVTSVFRPEDAQMMGIGGPTGGELYFELAPGYYPSNRSGKSMTAPYGAGISGGVHGFFPYRLKMGAIFYAAGPGLPRGATLPTLRQVDVFPTLCKAIGLPSPKNAIGVAHH